ncbi:hypothetical protein M9Y10_041807 [Tritrichomonas musculus]|uniref:Uncharacterized protein n=1 Tax=Tritrichomonas musculus TaxID=1915356 RepID=A0ABR2K5K8_9EUKA
MHPNAARTLHLLYRAENALSPDALLADPFLSSRLAINGAIPVSDLLSENSILSMNADQEELAEACKRSRILSVFPEQINGEYYILPGFYIAPNTLILRQVCSLGSDEELFGYCELLCGNQKDFALVPVNNGMDFYAIFQSSDSCFSFWRALKYVPYKGYYIKSEIYSPSLVRILPQFPISQPISSSQQKHEDQGQKQSSHPSQKGYEIKQKQQYKSPTVQKRVKSQVELTVSINKTNQSKNLMF